MSQSYDIIGDVHGRADALEELLEKLGYVETNGVYKHPEDRQVIFLGDLVDKGPQQRRVVEIAKAMTDAGEAYTIMGNHEFNAICYAEKNAEGEFIRSHTDMHTQQHQKFLDEYEFGSEEYLEVIEWFKTLPVYMDFPDFRVVHACWDDENIAKMMPYLERDNTLIEDAYAAYGRKQEPFHSAFDSVVKGPEVKLPGDASYLDANGHTRTQGRVLWWASPQTPNSEKISTGKKPMDKKLAHELDMAEKLRLDFMTSSKPTFIGHYYLNGPARHVSNDVTLLDYHGQVTAYSWNEGDAKQTKNRFIEIPSNAY